MVPLIAAVAISSVAAVTDIRSRRIPNLLTCSSMVLGVGYHTIINGPQGFLFSTAGLFLGIGLLVLFYLAGGMGAGDVKLMAAVGALLGPKGVFTVFIFTALAGGVYALGLLVLRFRVTGAAIQLSTMLSSSKFGASSMDAASTGNGKTAVLNYGVCIAIGVLLTALWNNYMR